LSAEVTGWLPSSCGLQPQRGGNIPAQGNAMGTGHTHDLHPEGVRQSTVVRNRPIRCRPRLCHALSGLNPLIVLIPRALPWAGMSPRFQRSAHGSSSFQQRGYQRYGATALLGHFIIPRASSSSFDPHLMQCLANMTVYFRHAGHRHDMPARTRRSNPAIRYTTPAHVAASVGLLLRTATDARA